MKLQIGLPALRGDLVHYANRFDALELLAEEGRLPRTSALRKWKAEVPEDFAFVVVLAPSVAALQARTETDGALAYAEQVANVLQPKWVLLRTPAAVTPSAAMRRRLTDLTAAVHAFHARLAWEPRGVWSEEEVDALAHELKLHVVRDGTREDLPAGPTVYTRLRALGAATNVGSDALERLAARLSDKEEALIIVEGQGAGRVRQALQAALTEMGDTETE